jgi:hypothetical protein
MASPIRTAKQPVQLAAPGPRVSRIRRDPPPIAKQTVVPADRDERDRWAAVIGIVAFTLAIVAIIVAFGSWAGWSPSQYNIHIQLH